MPAFHRMHYKAKTMSVIANTASLKPTRICTNLSPRHVLRFPRDPLRLVTSPVLICLGIAQLARLNADVERAGRTRFSPPSGAAPLCSRGALLWPCAQSMEIFEKTRHAMRAQLCSVQVGTFSSSLHTGKDGTGLFADFNSVCSSLLGSSKEFGCDPSDLRRMCLFFGTLVRSWRPKHRRAQVFQELGGSASTGHVPGHNTPSLFSGLAPAPTSALEAARRIADAWPRR